MRRRAEMTARPARVRIRRRKPWVRLRRRLLGWNVRLLTGKLPHHRSAQQIGYGADTARIAGGAGGCQRPLWKRPSNGTGDRQTGQTDAGSADANSADALGGTIRCQLGASVIAEHAGAPLWRTGKRAKAFFVGERPRPQRIHSATRQQLADWTSMSSGHAEQHGEYRRLACTATLRLLASRFASQCSLSYCSRRRSLVNLDGGER